MTESWATGKQLGRVSRPDLHLNAKTRAGRGAREFVQEDALAVAGRRTLGWGSGGNRGKEANFIRFGREDFVSKAGISGAGGWAGYLCPARWECVSVFDGALISRIPRALVLFLIGLHFFCPQNLYSVGQGAVVEFAAC